MKPQTLWVPGEPVPQPRQRHKFNLPSSEQINAHLPGKWATIKKGDQQLMTVKSFRQWLIIESIVSNYTPKTHPVNAWKDSIRSAWLEAFGPNPVEGVALGMSLQFVRKRPKAITRKTRPNPRLWDIAKVGDADNLAKAVFDALNGVAYKDDCQISRFSANRFISTPGEDTGVLIELCELQTVTSEHREIGRPVEKQDIPF